MKIVRWETWTVEMVLSEPYAVAYAATDQASNTFLRIETETGLCGYGCAGPDPDVTGETAVGVRQQLEQTLDWIKGRELDRPAVILGEIEARYAGRPGCALALDMALHDLWARHIGLPVWRLLGGHRERFPISVTIGIMDEAATIARARDWMAQGFRILKIKGGHDAEEDAVRMRRVREATGREVALIFDANQGYSVAQTRCFLDSVKDLDLAAIEQPVSHDDWQGLAELTRLDLGPIMADEAVKSPRDAWKALSAGICHLLNVKLTKCGGLRPALDINAMARTAGIPLMIGCMDESALAIQAGLAFALADANIAYADLDGHIGLVGDPAAGLIQFVDGCLIPNDSPGLGFNL